MGVHRTRDLYALQRAYATASGPDVLIVGDSMMTYVSRRDDDRRSLAAMVGDELPPGTTVHVIGGPGYNARLTMAYLSALETTVRGREPSLSAATCSAPWTSGSLIHGSGMCTLPIKSALRHSRRAPPASTDCAAE